MGLLFLKTMMIALRWLVLCAVLLLGPAPSYGQAVLTAGQVEFLQLSFNNVNINNPFWVVEINDETTMTTYTPTFISGLGRWIFDTSGGARFFIGGPQHLFNRPAIGSWNFIGVGPGEFFRATPQNADPTNQLSMGIATDLASGLFVNNKINVSMSVAGISNPGHFSYYSNDSPPNSATGNLDTVLLSTHDNINSFIYDTGTQNFFNMAFSASGQYNVDFQFSGSRTEAAGGGTIVSDIYRYTFDVALFPVPEPGTWAMITVVTVLAITVIWYARRRRRQLLNASVK